MKKIIVTGCSSGIGFYLAESLSKSDYKVIGLARNEPKEKYNFEFQTCDVRNLTSVKSLSPLNLLLSPADNRTP